MTPVLVVSGFLGAGKTTLVRRLLEDAADRGIRLAVLSNEFGDTGIDRALLDAGDDGIVELDGGCVCCRLSEAVPETVMRLLNTARPDRLVVETSGAALPGELLLQFWRPPLDARTTSPRVIVVVDAVAMHQGSTDATWEAQVDAADLLLLSKVDRVQDAVVQGCIAALGQRTGRAVWPVQRGDVDTDALWGLPPPPRRAPTGKGHATYGTETLHFDDDAPIDDVFRAIRVLRPLRAKGFLRQGGEIVVVQGVGDDLHMEPPRNPPPEDLVGLVVVIRAG